MTVIVVVAPPLLPPDPPEEPPEPLPPPVGVVYSELEDVVSVQGAGVVLVVSVVPVEVQYELEVVLGVLVDVKLSVHGSLELELDSLVVVPPSVQAHPGSPPSPPPL